ncbi:hypothetical protein BO82DRAFT_8077 [Aspergillus uvarum CBS 121591]|uniref:Uncharacterized protein n=1 Tax=Aspergillus uvarum CBS 121591 TaxID=1448315 RepID=A0A319CJP6_9EURO|nr:hypothetical protein BO82DRAFT_8077 [Aspergillus uvarum CBS 121591]PYH84589.1 hypothetical protein BO82DRAFT_8077 [Aspergillus uvarum CBS 121591]
MRGSTPLLSTFTSRLSHFYTFAEALFFDGNFATELNHPSSINPILPPRRQDRMHQLEQRRSLTSTASKQITDRCRPIAMSII